MGRKDKFRFELPAFDIGKKSKKNIQQAVELKVFKYRREKLEV